MIIYLKHFILHAFYTTDFFFYNIWGRIHANTRIFERKMLYKPFSFFITSGQNGKHNDLNLILELAALTTGKEWTHEANEIRARG